MYAIIILLLSAVLIANVAALISVWFVFKKTFVLYNVEKTKKWTDNKNQTVVHLTPSHERKLAEELGLDDEF